MGKKDFQTKKSLGQNFINDPGIISAVADASGMTDRDYVVEIGPGLGTFTEEFASRAKKLVAVELDDRLIPILRAKFLTMGNVEIVHEDILKFDFGPILEEAKQDNANLIICGNIPYYITTPIFLGILEKKVPAKNITAMVQKEVADRIVSNPGTKDYGVLSISLQYYCNCSKVLDVSREYFSPPPKVDSAVLVLEFKDRSNWPLTDKEESVFFSLVKTAFMQRRKTLLNSLEGFRSHNKDELRAIFEKIGIESTRRPETLTVEQFIALSKEI